MKSNVKLCIYAGSITLGGLMCGLMLVKCLRTAPATTTGVKQTQTETIVQKKDGSTVTTRSTTQEPTTPPKAKSKYSAGAGVDVMDPNHIEYIEGGYRLFDSSVWLKSQYRPAPGQVTVGVSIEF
jgi:hypothetical protein